MKRALATEMQLRQRRGWWASKRAMMRKARAMAMATATKRAMATDGHNTGNGDGKEGGERATAATMAMGRGKARRTWPPTLRLERGG
jgi:hypothetical protein